MNSEVLIDALIRELRAGDGPFSVSQLAVLESAARERKQREAAVPLQLARLQRKFGVVDA